MDMLRFKIFLLFLLGSLNSLSRLLSVRISCPKECMLFLHFSATVHFPRIGYATKDFNWYGTERLIQKYLATRGIPTLMYPFRIGLVWLIT